MTVSGSRAAQAAATAVLPIAVGPISTGVRRRGSAAAKSPLQLVLGQLDDGRSAVHVMGRQRRGEQPGDEFPDLFGLEVLARFDGGAARERRGEPLQPIDPAPEAPAGEMAHESLKPPPAA